YILPDGALYRFVGAGDQTMQWEPSEDLRIRLHVRKAYHTARLAEPQKDFRDLKLAYNGGPGWKWPRDRVGYGPDPLDPGKCSERLEAMCIEHQDAIDKIEEELMTKFPSEERAWRERQARSAGDRVEQQRQAAEQERVREAINRINI